MKTIFFINNLIVNNFTEIDDGVGKVNNDSSITGKAVISCGIEQLNLNILNNKDNYTFNVKGIGSIKLNGDSLHNDSKY